MAAGKKVFVTGASGFLGKHFIIELTGQDYDITVLTRNKSKLISDPLYNSVSILEGDLSDLENFSSEILQCNYFIHIAGEKKSKEKMDEVNLGSMKKILSIVGQNSGIKLMYISSTGVYGIRNQKLSYITEDMECFPENEYEKTKLAAEKYLKENSSLNCFVILRPSNIIGEFDKSLKLLNLMKSLMQGKFFYINRNAMVNYVSVKYVTFVMIDSINRNRFDNEIYNINSPCRLESMIEILKNELGLIQKSRRITRLLLYPLTLVLERLPKKLQLLNSEKYFALTNEKVYSNEKLKRKIAIDEIELLIHSLKSLVAWYRKEKLL
jgi:nucleoside-diphosphate-sugar epimerase